MGLLVWSTTIPDSRTGRAFKALVLAEDHSLTKYGATVTILRSIERAVSMQPFMIPRIPL